MLRHLRTGDNAMDPIGTSLLIFVLLIVAVVAAVIYLLRRWRG